MSEKTLPLVIEPKEFTDFLSQDCNDSNLRIIDLSSELAFSQGHIPGAIHLPFELLVSGHPSAPGKLPNLDSLRKLFGYLDLTEKTHFVVCDDEGGGWAGRFIWTLDVIGHHRYSYINGGMLAWRADGLPLEMGEPDYERESHSLPEINIDQSQLVDMDTILKNLESPRFDIWDARSPQEFVGIRQQALKRGHIPGAKNAEWTQLMDHARNQRIRTDAREFLKGCGLDDTRPIVTHCQSHHRSGFTYLVGKFLGFDIKAYDGSWAEWGNHPDTPVEIS